MSRDRPAHSGARIALLLPSLAGGGVARSFLQLANGFLARGYDVELVRAVSEAVAVPVIASGGMGKPAHLCEVVEKGKADAAAMADILHYDRATLSTIRAAAHKAGLDIRKAA